MKTILLILIFASVGYGQNFKYKTNIPPENHCIDEILFYYESYKLECYDTIIAMPFENQFIINHGLYQEMVSEKQLNKRGYIYKYRFIIDTNPMKIEYYFVKEPKGLDHNFMNWLKKQ